MSASPFGTVPASTNYNDWLNAQPVKLQEEVIGATRAKLFRNGVPITRFLDMTGETYTLKDLARMDTQLFL